MSFVHIAPLLKTLAIVIVAQPAKLPTGEEGIRLVISAKPRRKCDVPEVNNWDVLFVTGTSEDVDAKMNAPWLMKELGRRAKVVYDSEQAAATAPTEKTAAKAKATKATKAEAPKLTADELKLKTMVKDAQACLDAKDRKGGMAVFQQRIKPLFDQIKASMNEELKQNTIAVAKGIMELPEQLEIPE